MSNKIFFRLELSWVLVPLLGYLYLFVNESRSILLYALNAIGIIGIWDTILVKKSIINSKFGYYQFWGTILFHGIFFLTLLEFMKYGYPNLFSYLLLLVGCIVLYFLPWWPYTLTRETMIISGILIYLVLTIVYLVIKNFQEKINKNKENKNKNIH